MTDYAYPINVFPWHGTRLRDKENVFLSLIQRGNLNDAKKLVLSGRMRSGKLYGCRVIALLY
jgi:hypothetical protein